MDKNEFLSIEQQALKQVREGTNARYLLQILVLPFWGTPCNFEIFNAETAGHLVTQTIWYKDIDAENFKNPVERLRHPFPYLPTIEQKTVPLEAEFVQHTLQNLGRVTIPFWVEHTLIGLDGTTFEVAFTHRLIAARVQWWGNGPQEWQPLIKITQAAILYLENMLGAVKGRSKFPHPTE